MAAQHRPPHRSPRNLSGRAIQGGSFSNLLASWPTRIGGDARGDEEQEGGAD